jgi:hypothetical protein
LGNYKSITEFFLDLAVRMGYGADFGTAASRRSRTFSSRRWA